MARIKYREFNFRPMTLAIIHAANVICAEYAAQGLQMTLRQLYYQFVARGYLRNRQTEYNRLGSIINDARLAGMLDWDYIVDLTREVESVPHWDDPADVLDAVANQFRVDKWARQDYRPEVWIEKEALAGVIAPTCRALDVPYFAVRGYNSQSAQHEAAQRFIEHMDAAQIPIIFHLGDHDPSGIDMTRDNDERLWGFGAEVQVRRLALNMDQVRQYNPPPNPAKMTDSRVGSYLDRYGDESWELDALTPNVLTGLITAAVDSIRDETKWVEDVEREEEHRRLLALAADDWDKVRNLLTDEGA
jgi:hypothetical protein